jgi:tetratricopeptide (TPR) repeat protein
MPKSRIVVLGALAAMVAVGAWYGWRVWRDRQIAAVVRASVPVLPDLATWPPAYAARVRAAAVAASRIEQPIDALGELACLYHANAYYHEAEQAELGLHALEPKNARWIYYLADVYRNLGDTERTQVCLEQAFKLAPYYAIIKLELAELLLKQGRPDEAITHYEWRLTLVPKDPYARLGLARIALQRGDRTKALTYLETIVRDNPDFVSARNLLAEIYAHMGDAARADEQRRLSGSTGEFREADDPWLKRVYAFSFDPGRLETAGGNRAQARELAASLPFYQKAVRLAPGDGLAYDALGQLYLQLNQLADARATLEAGLAAVPQTTALYATLAQVLRKQGRPAEAIAVLQRGVRVLPNLPELRTTLGAALEDAGRRAEAEAAYREAVHLDPYSGENCARLGLCLLALGQVNEGRANLERALALSSGGPEVRQLLDRGLARARAANDQDAAAALEQLLARPSP